MLEEQLIKKLKDLCRKTGLKIENLYGDYSVGLLTRNDYRDELNKIKSEDFEIMNIINNLKFIL
jgi:hypothetical protein